ncbi:hypothetical protein J2Z69_001999 [Paenibacillus shirakamiensis]|uniref:Uncharacterized protein n=1 Tax=Paenibacillus shirakamiensis TaxID=1265935 RepID=A0ABS4JIL1_9BACL|nr:hypothetical protein [Paenibacillus shirakamiensis]MBP2000956.1 hypothetical protein [Paenibacillus shirakamiensis]
MMGPILPAHPLVAKDVLLEIAKDYDRFKGGLPVQVEQFILDKYGVDVSSRYGTTWIKNPFGKASGQLSVNVDQVKADVDAGLGFIVLKTVIAEDETGQRSMKEWAVKETRMIVSQITGKEDGELGWNVTWKGRGWYGTLESYIHFFTAALRSGQDHNTLIVPSCKYHLPGEDESCFHTKEYDFTTRALYRAWRDGGKTCPLQMEKDFSPTLAGSDMAKQKYTVLRWLRRVPELIKRALPDGEIQLGIKLMNSIFDDRFQLQSFRALLDEGVARPDYVIYANRLYDARTPFLGKQGAAYGGPDLSTRNLRILTALRRIEAQGKLSEPVPPLSGTGNIHSGKMAVEYALRGAESLQMHTIFQRPNSAFGMHSGSKTERALHELFFHPTLGLIAWMLHLKETEELHCNQGIIRFSDAAAWHRERGREYFQYI